MELDDGHGESDGHKKDGSSALTWKRRKRKIKTEMIKANVYDRFLFWHSRHHRGCECI